MKIPEKPPDLNFLDLPDIFQHLNEEELTLLVKEYNTRYLYWSEFKYKRIPEGITHEQLWTLLKINRNFNAERIKISNVSGFEFKYNLTSYIQEKLHEFDLNLGGTLEGQNITSKEDHNRYLINSIMEEAIASSQLEGASTSRKEAKKMLRQERKPKNNSEQMILNNYKTVLKLSRMKEEKITINSILELHRSITENTLEDASCAGKFRDSNDIYVVDKATGKIAYTPLNHVYINQVMTDFCEFANQDNLIEFIHPEFIHPIVKATILHFLIGYIHPFVDGNGRTARAIFYWYLLSKNYWLIEYMSISRMIKESPVQYSKAYLYTEFDENDLTYFINYQLKTLDSALISFKEYVARKTQEKNQLYDFKRIEGINERQAYILKWFSEDPEMTLTIKEIVTRLGVVYQTARTDAIKLESLGFLRKNKVDHKKFGYFRSKNFDQLLKNLID